MTHPVVPSSSQPVSQGNGEIVLVPSQSTGHSEDIPSNLYKPTAPLTAKVLESKRLTAEDSVNEVRHIVFDIAGSDLRYVEGQSIGVLPPGEDGNGKAHKLRLYSIASARQGDDGSGKTLSVCVKRVLGVDESTGQEFKGVCSNFLCDLKQGDSASLTGPVGKSFVMPSSPDANIIMVATGTGIAPFRGFMRRRAEQKMNGQAWLFFGAQSKKDYLYREEMDEFAKNSHGHIHTAFSREEKNLDGGRLYVQHRLLEQSEKLFEILRQANTYFYMCGLRGMEAGIQEALHQAAERHGCDWVQLRDQLKAEKRWHVEVY